MLSMALAFKWEIDEQDEGTIFGSLALISVLTLPLPDFIVNTFRDKLTKSYKGIKMDECVCFRVFIIAFGFASYLFTLIVLFLFMFKDDWFSVTQEQC